MAIKLTDFLNDTPEESKNESKETLTESVITETIQDNKPSPNLDAILQEWTWRCDKGYPDFNNLSDRFKLQEVLDESCLAELSEFRLVKQNIQESMEYCVKMQHELY